MPEVIQSRNSKNYISITNGEMARTISIGSNWNHIRMGILYNISSSLDLTAPNVFALGLCSGASSSFIAPTPSTYFVGLETPNAQTWGWYSSPPNGVYSPIGVGNSSFGTKIGTGSLTSYFNPFAGNAFIIPGLTGSGANPTGSWVRGIVFLDYTKVSGAQWPITVSYTGTNVFPGVYSDNSPDVFYNNITIYPYPNFNNACNVQSTVPITESVYGNLDTFDIYWNKFIGMEICEFAVYRFS